VPQALHKISNIANVVQAYEPIFDARTSYNQVSAKIKYPSKFPFMESRKKLRTRRSFNSSTVSRCHLKEAMICHSLLYLCDSRVYRVHGRLSGPGDGRSRLCMLPLRDFCRAIVEASRTGQTVARNA
jgi:hypothetical protein